LVLLGSTKTKSLLGVSEPEMSTDRTRAVDREVPDDPADLLPDDSVLDLDE
jgi:hypothetical protein